jgi:hypothetical protein
VSFSALFEAKFSGVFGVQEQTSYYEDFLLRRSDLCATPWTCLTGTPETLFLLAGDAGGGRIVELVMPSVGRDRVHGFAQNCFGEDRIGHNA